MYRNKGASIHTFALDIVESDVIQIVRTLSARNHPVNRGTEQGGNIEQRVREAFPIIINFFIIAKVMLG